MAHNGTCAWCRKKCPVAWVYCKMFTRNVFDVIDDGEVGYTRFCFGCLKVHCQPLKEYRRGECEEVKR